MIPTKILSVVELNANSRRALSSEKLTVLVRDVYPSILLQRLAQKLVDQALEREISLHARRQLTTALWWLDVVVDRKRAR